MKYTINKNTIRKWWCCIHFFGCFTAKKKNDTKQNQHSTDHFFCSFTAFQSTYKPYSAPCTYTKFWWNLLTHRFNNLLSIHGNCKIDWCFCDNLSEFGLFFFIYIWKCLHSAQNLLSMIRYGALQQVGVVFLVHAFTFRQSTTHVIVHFWQSPLFLCREKECCCNVSVTQYYH